MTKTILPGLLILATLFAHAQSPEFIRPDGKAISISRINQVVTSLMDTAAVTVSRSGS